MINATPQPLPQNRLTKLVRGLRQRMSSSIQQMADEVSSLNDELQVIEGKHEHNVQNLTHEFQLRRDDSITEWDEALNANWDESESMAYRAVFDTAKRESQLAAEAKAQIHATGEEAKKRHSKAEQKFLKDKEVPLARLKAFRQANSRLRNEANELSNNASQALSQHGIRQPKFELESKFEFADGGSKQTIEQFQSSIATAKNHFERLAHNRLATFLESAWWWMFCGLVLLGTAAGLTISSMYPLLTSVLIGCGATAVLLVGGLIGVRPWLKRIAATEYPKLMQQIEQGNQLYQKGEELAISENDSALKRLANEREKQVEVIKKWRLDRIGTLQEELDASVTELHARAKSLKDRASRELTDNSASTNSQFETRLHKERHEADEAIAKVKQQMSSKRVSISNRIDELELGGAHRLELATKKAVTLVTRSEQWCVQHFPNWQRLASDLSLWPETMEAPVMPIGELPMNELLPEKVCASSDKEQITAPLLFSPISDGYLTIEADPNLPATAQLVRNLLMRALTTLPQGKTQVCVIDPPGLGRDFGWLMHLADYDPQLVNHRVWTQPGHIAQQLSTLAIAAEDFIQQSLRNQYQNIVEYNREAGALSEPFRILVWSSLPAGLEDHSWKNLQSILDTGARCGIIPILIIDPAADWPAAQRDAVMRRGVHLRFDDRTGSLVLRSDEEAQLAIRPYEAAEDDESQAVVAEIGRRALLSSRVEVPLEKMIPAQEQWWKGDSSLCLEVPIGQSGVGRTHSLKLGLGTAQHAIIAGKTGSGKSSLLHAMITSAIVKYSPERLRLVLLDFKKGVEFQAYSQSAIAHADIIGIESHREFGLSSLEYIDGCMQRRGEQFRSAGVQDLASWNALHPDSPIPRMLLVIDEFQELFVEDDKLAQQASLILDRIVRQGRSFGVHAVLSSQTLAGSYSLPRTTLGQMAVRIALQCDPSDAQIIFAEDNPAATRLKHPGQAVYNDAGGRVEGNQPMQIGWMSKQEQLEWFGKLPNGYQNPDPSTNKLGRTVIYDGNRAATWDSANADLALRQSAEEVNRDATWCVTGESVAISPAVTFPITAQAGRNGIIVGSDDAQAAAVMNAVTASFVRDAQMRLGKQAEVHVVQGAKPTDARSLALPDSWKDMNCQLKIADIRKADNMLKQLYDELQRRVVASEAEEFEPEAPILVHLIQLGRLRTLRHEDDFGMGGFGEAEEMKPDKHLEELLKDGPTNGIHVMMWAESYSTVNRWLSRSSLREIEIRMLMQMSGNDSTNLIDSVAASRLGEHVMLLYDEATGQEQRFRPFDNDTFDELVAWQQNTPGPT